jgi:hypothetical protein
MSAKLEIQIQLSADMMASGFAVAGFIQARLLRVLRHPGAAWYGKRAPPGRSARPGGWRRGSYCATPGPPVATLQLLRDQHPQDGVSHLACIRAGDGRSSGRRQQVDGEHGEPAEADDGRQALEQTTEPAQAIGPSEGAES